MSWTGIGLVSQSARSAGDFNDVIFAPPALAPQASWTGMAGSGFATTPVDPVRTTAKPALRLLTPPFQWFTDTLDVGVVAAANDSGSMLNTLGIAEVSFYFEGNSVKVLAPSWHVIDTAVGPRRYFGWWVRLKKPPLKSGDGHLYVEAVARDVTMQKRVIGPYVFSPRAVQHDAYLSVTPSAAAIAGTRFQSLAAALGWCKANGKTNPLVTITEPGI